MRTFIFFILSMVSLSAFSADVVEVFNNNISEYVDDLLSPGNDVYSYCKMMLIMTIVIAFLKEVVVFMTKGLDPESHLTTTVMIFITLGLWTGYNTFIDVIWEAANGLTAAFQFAAVDNTDPMFLSKWVNTIFSRIVVESEVGFLGTVHSAMKTIFWHILVGLLQFFMYLVGLWAAWGITVAKIIGVIFIPFLALENTRPLFDGWFKFLIGFFILLIILRITAVITAITIQSQLETIGLNCSEGLVCLPVANWSVKIDLIDYQFAGGYSASEMTFTMIISILVVISSFKFAQVLASGIAQPSNSVGRGAKSIATKMATMIKGGV
ncbi:hypothetical protein [Candidatus Sororendozoicomonas aggregata]|uniref:hypothetical protein n=1 Tax=Candidatus Sororendozoicomonas aggregata TaxID=3073239 RepID=UPI002ED43A86